MKRLLFLFLFFYGNTIFAEPSLSDSSAVKAALLSEKDKYGIPNELYKIDDKLERYKNSIDYRLESNKRNGSGIIVGGVVGLVTSGILFAVAANNANKAAEMRNDPNIIVISDPSPMQYSIAVIDGIASLACIGIGIGMTNRTADIEPMKQYYNRSYGRFLSSKALNLFFSWTIKPRENE